MPKGPQGQKRPADAIGNAVMVAQIATGDIEDTLPSNRHMASVEGGKARAESLSKEQRSAISRKAAQERWS